jgi:hypothetical protein
VWFVGRPLSALETHASKPPVGPQWVHEIKHDGYRLIVRKQGDRVCLCIGGVIPRPSRLGRDHDAGSRVQSSLAWMIFARAQLGGGFAPLLGHAKKLLAILGR